jgi:hypothetical protein
MDYCCNTGWCTRGFEAQHCCSFTACGYMVVDGQFQTC